MEQDPDRLAHRTRKMRNGRIDGNDQVEAVDRCSSVGKVQRLLDVAADVPARVQRGPVVVSDVMLQAVEANLAASARVRKTEAGIDRRWSRMWRPSPDHTNPTLRMRRRWRDLDRRTCAGVCR